MNRYLLFFSLATASALAFFLFLPSSQKEIISKISESYIQNNDYKKEAEMALAKSREGLEEYKKLRVSYLSFEEELETAEKLFEEKEYKRSLQKASALDFALLNEIEKQNNKPKIVITFDAGAGAAPAEDLIGYLRETRAKITFFSTGKWAEQNPEPFKKILAPDGNLKNELGNHSYGHAHFISAGLSDKEIQNEIVRTEEIFENLGASAKPLFRYPYGERNSHTDALVSDLGYKAIGWSFDALGWKKIYSIEEIAERVESKARPGAIVLMHVGSPEDVAAFPLIVERLSPNYRFVFVSEL